MLKKPSSGVPRLAEAAVRGRSHHSPREVGEAGSEAQRTEAYASPLRSLRPCWMAFLSILTGECHRSLCHRATSREADTEFFSRLLEEHLPAE